MVDEKVLRDLDRHMTRARAFNEVLRALEYEGASLSVHEKVRGMYEAEVKAFDLLWDKRDPDLHANTTVS